MQVLLFIISFTLVNSVYSQNWQLKKDSQNIKVYTADLKNSSIKKYKIIGVANAPINKVYSLLTDYTNYTKMFSEISDFKLLTKNDSICITYSLFNMPWPIKKRDLITKIETSVSENIIIVSSKSINKPISTSTEEHIRICDFNETFILKKINEYQTECTITGHIDMGGSIPYWAQNIFITKSPPIKLIHMADSDYKND